MRTYTNLPPLPIAGPFERYRDSLGIIVPVARTNLVLNPSLETNTTGYTAVGGSIARSAADQFHGAYSLAVTPSASTTSGAYYTTSALTSGTTYAVSCKFRGVAGRAYALTLATTGGVDLVTKEFTATGFWQWIWLFYTETSSTARRVYVRKNGGADTSVFYVDGLQVEACGSEGVFVTTYIDGDQKGLVANQFPPAYLWSGTPHASTSSRSGLTRAGGRIVNFAQFGFLLTAIIGLGLSPVRQEALAFAQLDGAQYQDTIKTTRSFSLAGRMVAQTPQAHDAALGQLARLLDRDRVGLHQPLVITGQAQECGVDAGELWCVSGVYTGGLSGTAQELPTSQQAITFDNYLPFVAGRDGGAALNVQETIANANYIARRTPTGQWGALGSGMVGGRVTALDRASTGTIYAGGLFTDAGGSGADYIAQWDGTSWSVVGSATAINGFVRTITHGPSGTIYAGGDFTNAGGVANADYIAKWDGTSWSGLSTGMNAFVNVIAFAPSGVLYAAGNFTTAGGVAANRLAVWNGTAWQPLGSGTNAVVYALRVLPDGSLLVGGQFTTAGGFAAPDGLARWNGITWGPADFDAPGSAITYAMLLTPDGSLYLGYDTTGSAVATTLTTVTNAGTAASYPTLTITGPSSGTARIYQLLNTTTGAAIYFNLTLSAGETATLTLDPQNITFVSTFQGNILSTILPGSNTAAFALQPGANTISMFAGASTVSAILSWSTRYASIEDTLFQGAL